MNIGVYKFTKTCFLSNNAILFTYLYDTLRKLIPYEDTNGICLASYKPIQQHAITFI